MMLAKKIIFRSNFSENLEPDRQLAIDYAKAFWAQPI